MSEALTLGVSQNYFKLTFWGCKCYVTVLSNTFAWQTAKLVGSKLGGISYPNIDIARSYDELNKKPLDLYLLSTHKSNKVHSTFPQGVLSSSQWNVAGSGLARSSVVTGKDEQRVLPHLVHFESINDAADGLIQACHHACKYPTTFARYVLVPEMGNHQTFENGGNHQCFDCKWRWRKSGKKKGNGRPV